MHNEKAPLSDKLERQAGRAWLHMPGHGGNLTCVGEADTTELRHTEDLFEPGEALTEMCERMAKRAMAKHSLPFATGGTAAIHVMLLSQVRQGGTVLMPRTAHISAWSACALGGFEVIDIAPDTTDCGWPMLSAKGYTKAIQNAENVDAVLALSPDYMGCAPNLTAIADAAHGKGAKLLVDEAHGAHFPWMDGSPSAAKARADAWIHSAHKTLPALTGAAWLHLGTSANEAAARRMARLLTTSSPSWLVLSSMDRARAFMEESGESTLAALRARLAQTRTLLKKLGFGLPALGEASGFWRDDTRLVIDGRELGCTGWTLEEELSARAVDIEMATHSLALALPSVATSLLDIERLEQALSDIAANPRERLSSANHSLPALGKRVMSVREASFSNVAYCPLNKTVGRVSAVCAGAYPPGVPLVTPGEVVTPQAAAFLAQAPQNGARLFGISNGLLPVVSE